MRERVRGAGERFAISLGLRTTHPSKAYEQGAQEAAERIRKRMPTAFHEIGMALGQTLEDNPYKKD